MRYISVSMTPLFILLIAALSLPAAASDLTTKHFESWAMKKSSELDRIWTRAAAVEPGTAGSSSREGMRTAAPTFSKGRSSWSGIGARPPAGASSASSTGIDGSRFTKRGTLDLLWQTTRQRPGPSRGISKLESPAKTLRSSAFDRRLDHNVSSKYMRSTGYGRAGAWRKSPKMGARISSLGSRSRSYSMTRGATRIRRSARGGF